MIPPTLAPHLLDYAVNTLWQLPLLAAATWLLIRLTRPTTFTQHLLWIATLLLAATLPLRGYATYIPTPNLPVPHSSTASASMNGSTTIPEPAPKSALLHPHQIAVNPTLLITLVRLWLSALAVNLLRLTAAWITSRRLIASATHNPETLDPTFLKSCADRLQIPIPEIRFLNSPSATPVVAGIIHPILLLPTHLAHDYELTAILLHEFAHIRRRDTLANLLCRIVALPIAWHPVTPLLHARINQTREILCDALAAQASGSSTAYARSLLTLARNLNAPGQPSLATLPMLPANPFNRTRLHLLNPLEERIMKLIAPAAPRLSHRAVRISAGVALVTAATITAAAFHLQAASAAERHTPSSAIILTSSHLTSSPWQQLTPSTLSARQSESPATLLSAFQAAPPPAPPTVPPAPAPAPQVPAPPQPSPIAPAPVGTLGPLAPLPPLPANPHGLVASAPFSALAPLAPVPFPPLPPAPAVLQTVPAPPAPAPVPTPTPAPSPQSGHHSRIIIDGTDRPLTPAEQADLDKQLVTINAQVKAAMASVHIDQKQLNEKMKQLKSPEFARQMASVQKQLNSPEFQKQIAEATRLASTQAMNSDAMREQMAHASAEIAKAQAEMAKQHLNIQLDSKIQADVQAQVKAATDAIAHTRFDVHIDTADLQRQLDQAQKQIDEARRRIQDSKPQP